MPLRQGYSRNVISSNIRELYHANAGRRGKRKRSRAQIVAIALSQARRSADRRGAHPGYLLRGSRRSKRRASHRRMR